MTIRTIACGACGADVPHGRLSCPACGELLASVSGAVREAAPSTTATGSRALTAPDDRPLFDALLDDDPEVVVDAAAEDDHDPVDDPGPAWPPVGAVPAWPDRTPTPTGSTLDAATPPPPGAYLPPNAAPPPAPAVLATAAVAMAPAGPPAPARAWAGAGAAADTGAAAPDTTTAAADRARVDEAIGWVAIGACAIALLGFLIPWARTVIGSGGADYVDQWGLAGPGHLVIVLGLGLILAGALVPNRIPAWLRLGIPGLVIGAILIGLVWPYVLGPLGALPGAFLSLAGALTLVGVSIASIVIDRHADRASAV